MLLYKISYSYFISKRITETKETIVTGDLTSTLTITGLNLGDMEPMSDTDGMAQTNYATITINKNNIYKVFYKILIGYDIDDVVDHETLLPMEYIHAAIYPINAGVVADNPLAGPLEITDLTVEEIEPTNVYTAKYFLAFDTLEEETQNQTKSYALKVWLKEGTPESYDSKVVNLDIGLKQETLISKSKYNIKGKIYTFFSEPSPNSVLTILQNNNITTTSDSSGLYTLANVPEGTYTLKVYDPNMPNPMSKTSYRAFHLDLNGPVGGALNITNVNIPIGSYAPVVSYTYYLNPNCLTPSICFPNDFNHPSTAENFVESVVISGEDNILTTDINNVGIKPRSGFCKVNSLNCGVEY